mmetsp:Transcript_110735/g.319925  ORF Transcript_110735/g.319925 Transcript_110735/m.319925 type:complete len:221 (-) Transcript_110735:1393-2055(-)
MPALARRALDPKILWRTSPADGVPDTRSPPGKLWCNKTCTAKSETATAARICVTRSFSITSFKCSNALKSESGVSDPGVALHNAACVACVATSAAAPAALRCAARSPSRTACKLIMTRGEDDVVDSLLANPCRKREGFFSTMSSDGLLSSLPGLDRATLGRLTSSSWTLVSPSLAILATHLISSSRSVGAFLTVERGVTSRNGPECRCPTCDMVSHCLKT